MSSSPDMVISSQDDSELTGHPVGTVYEQNTQRKVEERVMA